MRQLLIPHGVCIARGLMQVLIIRARGLTQVLIIRIATLQVVVDVLPVGQVKGQGRAP